MGWIRHLARQQLAVRRGAGTPQSHFDEQLADFFEHQLSDEERERLLALPGDEMQSQLRELYLSGPGHRSDHPRHHGRWLGGETKGGRDIFP